MSETGAAAHVVTSPDILPLGHNPRYATWARMHGRTPEEQVEADRVRWPGGSMCGFVLWNGARLREYAKINPDAFWHHARLGRDDSPPPARITDHAAYDAWLDGLPEGHGLDEDDR